MNTALVIIGLSMLIFLVVFYLKRAKEKRKAWLEEREKIKAYGEEINEETRNKNKWKNYMKSPFLNEKKIAENNLSLGKRQVGGYFISIYIYFLDYLFP